MEKIDDIKAGQEWVGADGNVVEITGIREIKNKLGEIIDHEVHYMWKEKNGEIKTHKKLAFAFQCRYGLKN